MEKIDLQQLTLRTISALLVKPSIFSSYLLQQLKKKLESKDESIYGEVRYKILTKKNRIVELEHETGFV